MKKQRLSPAKANKMLAGDRAQGHPLTPKQKKLFQAVAHGLKPKKRIIKSTSGIPSTPVAPYFGTAKGQANTPSGEINPYKAKRKVISFPKKEIVEEHKELVHKLKHGSKKQLAQEAKKQGAELKEYERQRSVSRLKRGMKGYMK